MRAPSPSTKSNFLNNLRKYRVRMRRMHVDDYGTFGGCKAAIDEYRAKHKITAPLHYIREDPTLNTRLFGYAQKDQRKDVFEAVWWQKE